MNHFDELAKLWDDNEHRQAYAAAIANYIELASKDITHVSAMELGAGTGVLSLALSDFFESITLIDSSKGMLDVLKSKITSSGIKHMFPILQDATALETNKNFDVVYSAMFFHHIKDVTYLIKKLKAMVKPNGKLFVCDLYTELGDFHSKDMKGVYHLGFDPEVLANLLKQNGFTINNIQTIYTFEKNDKSYPVFIIEATLDN